MGTCHTVDLARNFKEFHTVSHCHVTHESIIIKLYFQLDCHDSSVYRDLQLWN